MARTAVLSILILVSACGGGGGEDPVPRTGTGPATVSAYCDLYWSGLASRWAACAHGSAAYFATVYSPALRCGDTEQAVTAGRATYAPGRAGACLAFVDTASCAELEALLAARSPQADCLAAVAGRLAEYETCYSSESCASDLCVGSPGSCPSICATPLAQGAPCGFPSCARGLHCASLSLSPTCQPLAAQGASCMYDIDCQLGLRCDYSTMIGTCQPRRTSGSCGSSDAVCAIGYACVSGSCVRLVAAGETCTQGNNECGSGLWCSGGHCVDGPTATQDCAAVNGEYPECIGARCESGKCVAWLSEGGTCSLSAQCEPTASCVGSAPATCTTLCAEP